MSYCLWWLISTSLSQLYLCVELLNPLFCCNELLLVVRDIKFILTALSVFRAIQTPMLLQ